MLYRLYNVTGYEAFYLAGAALHASRTQKKPSADASRTYIEDFKAPGFKDVSLRFYLNSQGLHEVPHARPLAYHADTAYLDLQPAEILEMRPERRKLRLPPQPRASPTLIVAQAFYPGWKAWIDGKPSAVEEHGNFLQKIHIEGQDSRRRTLVLRFNPWRWKAAIAFSFICLGAALLWARHLLGAKP